MNEEKPIRVAQIMGKLWAGGVEAVVFNYYHEIDKSKIQFDFYYDADSTVDPPQELIDMGARFIKIPPYQKLFLYLKTLRKYFRENNYCIVHSHINTLSVFPLFVAWLEKIPVRIAHNHSVPGGNEFWRNALKIVLRKLAKVFPTHYFACSEKAGRWMFGNKAFDQSKVFVLKNAVDFERFRTSPREVQATKEELGVVDKFVVGHVGRFTYTKNHSLLLDIFSEICKMRDDAMLMLVGDGELHDEIIARIQGKDLSEKVLLVGRVTDPQKYYRVADVIVIPSHFEGLSLTTIESQIAGVPVVISEAIPEEAVISDGYKYMKLINSPKDWARATISMINCKVNLNENSDEYNIIKKADSLAKWYRSHYKF